MSEFVECNPTIGVIIYALSFSSLCTQQAAFNLYICKTQYSNDIHVCVMSLLRIPKGQDGWKTVYVNLKAWLIICTGWQSWLCWLLIKRAWIKNGEEINKNYQYYIQILSYSACSIVVNLVHTSIDMSLLAPRYFLHQNVLQVKHLLYFGNMLDTVLPRSMKGRWNLWAHLSMLIFGWRWEGEVGENGEGNRRKVK